jgi:hypothetical protein
MAIFNSYVSLPEGISADFQPYLATPEIIIPSGAVARRIAAGASGIMQLGSLDFWRKGGAPSNEMWLAGKSPINRHMNEKIVYRMGNFPLPCLITRG